jgi:hypothetical protein
MGNKRHFTKEEFMEFIAEYKFPDCIDTSFWDTRPDKKTNFLDPAYIISTARNLQKFYVNIPEIDFIEDSLKLNKTYEAGSPLLN